MKINRVTLYNFSSYVGENTIALGTHNEQNIILIGGNNGAGKTSFFTAIKLALYGPQCFRFQDKKAISTPHTITSSRSCIRLVNFFRMLAGPENF